MSILLLILALILRAIFSPILFVYALFTTKWGPYFKELAISIDSFGNVLGGPLFNRILRKNAGYSFGNRRDTISHAMHLNDIMNNLSPFGLFVKRILNLLEPNHLEKSK